MIPENVKQINDMMEKISKIGKCPTCYFERRKHKLTLIEEESFQISTTYNCNRCGGIYSCCDVIECVNMDIKKSRETLLKYDNRDPEE